MADLYEKLKRFQQSTTPSTSPKPEERLVPASHLVSDKTSRLEKLLQAPGLARARDLIDQIEKRDAEKKQFLESIGVVEVSNEAGSFGFRETIFAPRAMGCRVEDFTGPEMVLQTRDDTFSNIDPARMLFLDTETTGLAGGAGTVPFLVGIGSFEKEGFRVRQYLMRDYDEEPAVLRALHEEIEACQAVATYNGKRFDIPILDARFVLNRLRPRLSRLPHADFLVSARRFWREMLPECRLITVEARIFGRTREDDIPGEQIPYVYFDFLRGQRLDRMRPVLHHNADDIATLAMIGAKTSRMLRDPLAEAGHGLELAAVGRFFEDAGDWERACACWDHARQNGNLPHPHRNLVSLRLSLLYKKMARYPEAIPLWYELAEGANVLRAYIELAIYYEHTARDFATALRLTATGLDLMENRDESGWILLKKTEDQLQRMKRRRHRLIQKLKR